LNYTILTGIDKIDRKTWTGFIDSHPQGTVFQSPAMYDLFESAGKMGPVALACVDEENSIAGILLAVIIREKSGPAGYFSRRTVVYGGPVVQTLNEKAERRRSSGERRSPETQNSELTRAPEHSDINSEFSGHHITDLLLKALIREVGKRSVFIQFRNFTDQEELREVFEKNGFTLNDRLNLLVDTSSLKTVKSHMSESRWRQVRKSLEQGAWSREPENIEEVRVFYDILNDLYRNKVRKPLPGWSFFENFYRLSNNGLNPGVILLVEYREKIIGGILCPVTAGKVIYEWYVCGLDREYRHVYPSVLATWAAMEYAINNNIPQFDFMGVGLPHRPYGVREFKKRFGGSMVNYGRFSRINNKTLYHIAELGYNVLALMKRI
jgi:serine/alanine adding enzyme